MSPLSFNSVKMTFQEEITSYTVSKNLKDTVWSFDLQTNDISLQILKTSLNEQGQFLRMVFKVTF